MPCCELVFFAETDGSAPVLGWLREVARRDPRVAQKLRARLEVLADYGTDLRRPTADSVGDGLYELRARFGSGNTSSIRRHTRTKSMRG